MKALARSHVWWPLIDLDIERIAKECLSCSRFRNNPPKTNYHPWDYAIVPWQRIHIDYAGPFLNTYFFIIVDSYTKWIEVFPTSNMTANTTINILRETFARFGLPYTVVSDNGSNFISKEFEDFLKMNGIKHKLIAPYHPATNGQAERYVQTVKKSLRSMQWERGNLHLKLSRFLMQNRKTPNITTGVSPAELIFKRNIRTRIDLVKLELSPEMQEAKLPGDKKDRSFEENDTVLCRHYGDKNQKWKYGTIVTRNGNLNYEVCVDGRIQRRHVDQLLPYNGPIPFQGIPVDSEIDNKEPNQELPTVETEELPRPISESTPVLVPEPEQPVIVNESGTLTLRRSTRIRKPVDRLNL
ncbi:uncharacterized protein K02A2.6 [Tribolium castaneum]|nr:PREDICTED: uncharacterized protein K02A2.6 [Tribolium castaneum]|eukprot:XP_008200522.1 PREDICTED: uncharacterized protein K02A2.6 [Tribolium castaneum]